MQYFLLQIRNAASRVQSSVFADAVASCRPELAALPISDDTLWKPDSTLCIQQWVHLNTVSGPEFSKSSASTVCQRLHEPSPHMV